MIDLSMLFLVFDRQNYIICYDSLWKLFFVRIKAGAKAGMRQGLERHPGAAAADVFCWRVAADEGSPRTAYKNTTATRRV